MKKLAIPGMAVGQVKKAVALIALVWLACPYLRSQRPNIIYIMADDMGYGDLGCYGSKDHLTPNIDKLASEGMKFVNAYSAAPLCTPTRTAFLTGRYPARTPVGLIEPLTGAASDTAIGLTPEYTSIAALVKAAGYQTALIGKWHLGVQARHNPTRNGFDYFFGMLSGAADYHSHMTGPAGQRKHDLYENDSPVFAPGYLTELFSQKAISFIRGKHEKPFFLTLAFNAPHWPWIGPYDKAYDDSVDFRKGGSADVYAAMMKNLDQAVGNIMETLDKEGLSGETIVIFTNDNGGERYSDQGGLSNGKGTLWEGGIRVPAFVRWPSRIRPGITAQAAITMDWSATILAAAGVKPDPKHPLDGLDLMPVLTGGKADMNRPFYWRTFQRSRQKAMREGNWKYLQDEKGEYLFDLSADPAERNDLKPKENALFDRLKEKYAEWEKTILPPKPL